MKIELKDISFGYPDTKDGTLKDIDITVDSGEFVLLAGTSGCGKTTIIRILNGLIPSFYNGELSGRALLDGKPISEYKSYELSSVVGSVFQNPRTQFFNVDTDSEIVFGLENACVPSERINEVLDKTTEDLDISKLRERNIFELSGGEKQKIAFASVYASDPDVFLLDEPSANLDRAGIEELRKCLCKIKGRGKTVIIAEHRLYYLADLVDRVVVLEHGMIKKEMTGDVFRAMRAPELNLMGLRTNNEQQDTCSSKTDENAQRGLSLSGLCVQLGRRMILENLNKEFLPGKVYCVTGHNGAGKSTLLRTISGLIRLKSGTIMIDGKPVSSRQLKRKVFMVMQDVNYQLFADSVINECTLGAKEKDADNAERVLSDMALWEYRERHPNTLSGGQKQRLAIAVSLMMDKDILLFDEPTSGLDYRNMLLCADLMKRLADKGKIIIVVTHDVEFMNQCCDKVYSLA